MHKLSFLGLIEHNYSKLCTNVPNYANLFIKSVNYAINVSNLSLYFNRDGTPKTVQHEETRVWHRKNGRWVNVHIHRSINSNKAF